MSALIRAIKKLPRRTFLATSLVIGFVGSGAVVLADSDHPDNRINEIVTGGHGILRSGRAIRTVSLNLFKAVMLAFSFAKFVVIIVSTVPVCCQQFRLQILPFESEDKR